MITKPPHQPTAKTRAEVEALTAYGVPQHEVAKYIGIDTKTMRKWYSDELESAKTKAHAKVGKFLFEAATGQSIASGASYADCIRAAMFWSKTQMGFREKDVSEEAAEIARAIEIVRATRPD